MPDEVIDSVYEKQYSEYGIEKSYVFSAAIPNRPWAIDFNAIPPKYRDTLGRNINHCDVKPNLLPKLVACDSALKAFIENPRSTVYDFPKYIRLGLISCQKIQEGDFLSYNYNDTTADFSSKKKKSM